MRPPFHLPLDRLPEIVQVGTNTHGHLPSETYRHTDYWGFHLYTYTGAISFDGLRFPFRNGFASITPPRTEVTWHFPANASHYYCLFRYGGGGMGKIPPVQMPVTRDLGQAFVTYLKRLDEAMAFFRVNPPHASVILADLLYRLGYHAGESPKPATDPTAQGVLGKPAPARGTTKAEGHPKLLAAVVHIETHLHRPLEIGAMAAFLNISVTHLERLFREAFGSSIQAYLRRMRAERARHFLTASSLPISGIARAVGIPDLHQFNKVLRRELGKSPRAIREDGGT